MGDRLRHGLPRPSDGSDDRHVDQPPARRGADSNGVGPSDHAAVLGGGRRGEAAFVSGQAAYPAHWPDLPAASDSYADGVSDAEAHAEPQADSDPFAEFDPEPKRQPQPDA